MPNFINIGLKLCPQEGVEWGDRQTQGGNIRVIVIPTDPKNLIEVNVKLKMDLRRYYW